MEEHHVSLRFYNSVGVMPPRGGFDDIPLDWTSDSKKHSDSGPTVTEFGERNGKILLGKSGWWFGKAIGL